MENNDDSHIELYTNLNNKKRYYLAIDKNRGKILIDIEPFGYSCFMCICHDGQEIYTIPIDNKNKKHFVDIDWMINDWGTDKKTIDSLVDLKDKFNHKLIMK